jgi:hypothetical protein
MPPAVRSELLPRATRYPSSLIAARTRPEVRRNRLQAVQWCERARGLRMTSSAYTECAPRRRIGQGNPMDLYVGTRIVHRPRFQGQIMSFSPVPPRTVIQDDITVARVIQGKKIR